MSIAAILLLAAGTYAIRFAGPLLGNRIELSEERQEWLRLPAIALLAGLVATAALYSAAEFAGWARVIGVAVAALAAWRRAPFVVVVIAAAAVTALLRLAGVP